MPIRIAKGWPLRMNRKHLVLGVSLGLMVWHIHRSTSSVYMVSDALFFVSVGLLVAGAAEVVSNSGLFDIVVFSTRLVTALITNKPPEEGGSQQSFAQYIQRKRKTSDVRLVLIAGCLCLLASLLAAAVSL